MPNKHSLVIGINTYQHFPNLSKCENDATDIHDFLSANGFTSEIILNPKQKELNHTITNFKKRIEENDISLIYFSGHGLQDDKHNYLVCEDSNIEINEDIKYNCIWVEDLFLNNQDENLHMIILDACRDNPFQDGRKSIKFGLLKMLAPQGTFISFSTSPNSKSIERSTDRNGIFTKHLLNNIKKPNLPIELAFKQTRNNVLKDTSRRQIPWEESSLTGDNFCFVVENELDPIIETVKGQFASKMESVKLPIVLQALLKPKNISATDYHLLSTLFDICGDLEWWSKMPSTLDADYISDIQMEESIPALTEKVKAIDNTNLEDFVDETWDKIEIIKENNFGYYRLVDLEEFVPTIYSNEIEFEGKRGVISCFLFESDENEYRLKPLIAYFDEQLIYNDYKEIKGDQVVAFMEKYLSIRKPYVKKGGPIWDDVTLTTDEEN